MKENEMDNKNKTSDELLSMLDDISNNNIFKTLNLGDETSNEQDHKLYELLESDRKDKLNKVEAKHDEIKKLLEELKKPHWSVLPTFWLVLISAIATIIGIFISLESLKKPSIPEQKKIESTQIHYNK